MRTLKPSIARDRPDNVSLFRMLLDDVIRKELGEPTRLTLFDHIYVSLYVRFSPISMPGLYPLIERKLQ